MALERPSALGSAGAQWWWYRGRSTGGWRAVITPLDPLRQVVHCALGMAFADELVRLIAAGKSNREIAKELFISLNTVANHVRNILTKTDTANRAEAAAFAISFRLIESE